MTLKLNGANVSFSMFHGQQSPQKKSLLIHLLIIKALVCLKWQISFEKIYHLVIKFQQPCHVLYSVNILFSFPTLLFSFKSLIPIHVFSHLINILLKNVNPQLQ
jgi:hypothetical protein